MDSRASETRARLKITPPHVSPFSRGIIFTRARVSLCPLSLRKNGVLIQRFLGKRDVSALDSE